MGIDAQTPHQLNEDELTDIASKFKHRLNCLKDTTTKLFKQHNYGSDLLHDCIIQIKYTLKHQTDHSTLQQYTPRTLFSDESTEDMDSSTAAPAKLTLKTERGFLPIKSRIVHTTEIK